MTSRICMTCGQPYYVTPPPDVCHVCKGTATIVERPVAVVALGEARVRELEADMHRAELWAVPDDTEEPPETVFAERYEALEKHAARQHAELVRETRERVELGDRYEHALHRIGVLEDVLQQLHDYIPDEVWAELQRDWGHWPRLCKINWQELPEVDFKQVLGLHRTPRLVPPSGDGES